MSLRVLVTGAARAPHPQVARRLLARGAGVVLAGAEGTAPPEGAPAAGGPCWVAPPGLGGPDLVAFARDRLDGLDALVHGDEGLDEAALLDRGALPDRVAEVFVGIHTLTAAAVAEMARRRVGRIVFLLSAEPGGTGPVLRAGKLALMRSLAAELQPLGIACTALTLLPPALAAAGRGSRRAPPTPSWEQQAELLDIALSPTLGLLVSGQHLGGGPDDPEARPTDAGWRRVPSL